jgi:hypothetical protein
VCNNNTCIDIPLCRVLTHLIAREATSWMGFPSRPARAGIFLLEDSGAW